MTGELRVGGMSSVMFSVSLHSQTSLDCGLYKQGQGLDKNGQPFQVIWLTIFKGREGLI